MSEEDIPEKADLKETIEFTGEEIKFIERVMSEVESSSMIPLSTGVASYTPLRQIRKKMNEASNSIYQSHRELRSERSCEEDGHSWGSTHYYEESNFGEIVSRGCRYCPAAQYKKVGEDKNWQTVESIGKLGTANIGAKQE